MFHPTKYHWLAINRSANIAQAPPDRGQSATLFASTFLLGAIGTVALIAMIASAPARVASLLRFVFVAHALGAAVASLADRHRGRAIETRRAIAGPRE
jgi:hypothetical protein